MTPEWNVQLVSGPAVEPLTMEEVLLHLRLDDWTEGYPVYRFLQAARQHYEDVSGWVLINQTFDEFLSNWPCANYIELHRYPLSSITSIKYFDSDGVEQTMPTTDYVADTRCRPSRVWLTNDASWPSSDLRDATPIAVRYVAGLGTSAASVPAPLLSEIKLLITDLYELRQAIIVGEESKQLTLPVVRNLIGKYRNYAF